MRDNLPATIVASNLPNSHTLPPLLIVGRQGCLYHALQRDIFII